MKRLHKLFDRSSRHGERRFMRLDGGRGHGGRGGRIARILGHGDLRLLVLHLINENPRHGYELIKAIEEISGGVYAPSPGVIYPTLTMLEDVGHVVAASEGPKKLFTITEDGRKALEEAKPVIDTMLARLATMPPRETMQPVIRAMENLKLALRMKLGSQPPQAPLVNQVTKLIDELARSIEQL